MFEISEDRSDGDGNEDQLDTDELVQMLRKNANEFLIGTDEDSTKKKKRGKKAPEYEQYLQECDEKIGQIDSQLEKIKDSKD